MSPGFMETLLSLAAHVPGVCAQIPDRGLVFGELERKDVALSDDAENPLWSTMGRWRIRS